MRPWLRCQTFPHSEASQESQVVKKTILNDGVLSPHRCAFKPGDNGEKPVRELKGSWESFWKAAMKSLIYATFHDHFNVSQP